MKLEVVQNEALRVILGVQRSAKIECNISSVESRVNEIMMNVCLRILSDKRDHPLKESVISGKKEFRNHWLRELKREIMEIGLCRRIYNEPVLCKRLESWLRIIVDVRVLKRKKKPEMIKEKEKACFST